MAPSLAQSLRALSGELQGTSKKVQARTTRAGAQASRRPAASSPRPRAQAQAQADPAAAYRAKYAHGPSGPQGRPAPAPTPAQMVPDSQGVPQYHWITNTEGKRLRMLGAPTTVEPADPRNLPGARRYAKLRAARTASFLDESAARRQRRLDDLQSGLPSVLNRTELPGEPVLNYLNTPGYVAGNALVAGGALVHGNPGAAAKAIAESGKNIVNLIPGTRAIGAVRGRETNPSEPLTKWTGYGPWWLKATEDTVLNPATWFTFGAAGGAAAARAATAVSRGRWLGMTTGQLGADIGGTAAAERLAGRAAAPTSSASRVVRAAGPAPRAPTVSPGRVTQVGGVAVHAPTRAVREARIAAAKASKLGPGPRPAPTAPGPGQLPGQIPLEIQGPAHFQLPNARGPYGDIGSFEDVARFKGPGPGPPRRAPGPANPLELGAYGGRYAKAREVFGPQAKGAVVEHRPVVVHEPTAAQAQTAKIFGEHATLDEWIQASGHVTSAYEKALRLHPRAGVRIDIAGTQGKGIDIPLLPKGATQTWRSIIRNPRMEAARHRFVTQFGPHRAVADMGRAAFSWADAMSGRDVGAVEAYIKKAGLTKEERLIASHVVEGTVPWLETKLGRAITVSPKVQKAADELTSWVEKQTDAYIRAGGDVTKLDAPYLAHMIAQKHRAKYDAAFAGKQGTRHVRFGKPGFTRHRSTADVTIADIVDAKIPVAQDIGEIVARRLAAGNQAMAELRLVRNVERSYGRHLPPGEFMPGYVGTTDAPSVVSGLTSAPKGGLAIPKDAAETLANIKASQLAGRFPNARAFNRRWKSLALATPGYDIRNQIGDMLALAQEGRNPFQGITGPAKRRILRTQGPKGTNLTWDEAAKLIRTMGGTMTGQLPHEAAGTIAGMTDRAAGAAGNLLNVGTIRKIARGAQKGRVGRENLQRLYPIANELAKKGPVMALRRSRQASFDYGDVGSVVQGLRTNPFGAPFITWTAKNLPAQVRRAAQRPRSAIALNQLMAHGLEGSGYPNPEAVPDYLKRRIAIPVPGVGWVSVDPVQNTLNLISPGQEGLGGLAKEWAGQLAPATQAAVAAAYQVRPLTGQPFGGQVPAGAVDRAIQSIPGIGPALLGAKDTVKSYDSKGRPVQIAGANALGHFLLSAFSPQSGQITKLGGEAPGQSWLQQNSPQLFGVRYQPFDDKRAYQQAIAQRVGKYLDLLQQIRKYAKVHQLPVGDGTDPALIRANAQAGSPLIPEFLRTSQELKLLMADAKKIGVGR